MSLAEIKIVSKLRQCFTHSVKEEFSGDFKVIRYDQSITNK